MKSLYSFRPNLENLDGRVMPSSVAVAPTAPAAVSNTYEWTGPLGGTVTATTTTTGNRITETIIYVGPNGRTVTQTGEFTIDYRNGTVAGTYAITGPNGRVVTGSLTLQSGSVSTTAIGPNGKSLTLSATMTQNGEGGTLISYTIVGPNGGSYSGSFTVPPSANR